MDCKRVEKKIPKFLNNEMDVYSLKAFLKHVESCPECKEELSIQFLVTEGMNALENGDSYDLKNALENRLKKSYHEIDVNNRLFWIRNIVFALSIVLLLVCIALIYFYLYF